jgi:hypothetical protein
VIQLDRELEPTLERVPERASELGLEKERVPAPG